MTQESDDQRREIREQLTTRAMADTISAYMSRQRIRQMSVVRATGISRSHLRSVLRAEKRLSVPIFFELSEFLHHDDPSQVAIEVLARRAELLAEHAQTEAAHT